MKKLLQIFVLVIFAVFVALQFMRPDRTNPTVNESETLQATNEVPIEIDAILKRSCNDCHSNQTNYPWYSNIAPISWSVVDHINLGREELNFSIWATYSDNRKSRKLEEICEEIESRNMPHNQYLWLHWDAKLSDEDIKLICDWTETETKKLLEKKSVAN